MRVCITQAFDAIRYQLYRWHVSIRVVDLRWQLLTVSGAFITCLAKIPNYDMLMLSKS